MRQVGDRLIPVGVTSGRVHALSPEEAAAVAENGANGGGGGTSWRSRRRQQGAPGGNGIEQYLGQDLEEVCFMFLCYRFVSHVFVFVHTANDDGGDEIVVDRS